VVSIGLRRQPPPKARFRQTADGELVQLQSPLGTSVIDDGEFSSGLWGPIGNCDDAYPVHPPEVLSGTVETHGGPSGVPALQLTANVDSACEQTPLKWHTGDISLRLWTKSVKGAPARICVWEEPIDRCATEASLSEEPGWHQYKATIHPDPGTSKMILFLYADSMVAGQRSVERYAGVVARTIPPVPYAIVLGTPIRASSSVRLFSLATGYSSLWSGPPGATHVVVDGLRNGWIAKSIRGGVATLRYVPAIHIIRNEVILGIFAVFVAAVCWWGPYRRGRIRAAGNRSHRVM
jgi:hypothetical protein